MRSPRRFFSTNELDEVSKRTTASFKNSNRNLDSILRDDMLGDLSVQVQPRAVCLLSLGTWNECRIYPVGNEITEALLSQSDSNDVVSLLECSESRISFSSYVAHDRVLLLRQCWFEFQTKPQKSMRCLFESIFQSYSRILWSLHKPDRKRKLTNVIHRSLAPSLNNISLFIMTISNKENTDS